MNSRATVIGNLPFTIDEKQVLREMRVSKITKLSELEERPLAEGIAKAINSGYTLIKGKGVYKTLELKDGAVEQAPQLFSGQSMAKLLDGCSTVSLLAVTIGNDLEAQVESLDKAGDMTEAYLLEMVGGLMADYMADRVDERIVTEMKKTGLERTMRFSPGYGDWPLEKQPELIRLVEAERIGISVTESHIMLPRKSVSAVIGWKGKD